MSASKHSSRSLHLPGRLALSFAEAAEALGVSETHLRAHRHELPVMQIGGRLVLPVDELRVYLRDRVRQERELVKKAVDEVLDSLD